MKKTLKRLTAVLLSCTLLFTTTKISKAASAEYISDVMVYCAGSFEEAEAGLKALGYEIVKNSNLNGTFKTGVYLGYKTTDNADEAITDLAAMNMTGKYSYGSYETIMENQKSVIKNSIESFLPSLAAFQENYENGTRAAELAYETMNLYLEDDTNTLMGDYLLAFDFSDQAVENLTKVFMQGNAELVLSVEKAVALGAETEGETLLTRMSDIGPEGIEDRYMSAYPTMAKALQAMSKDYGAAAAEVLSQWDNLYNYLTEVENELIDADGEDLKENVIDDLQADTLVAGPDATEDMKEVADVINGTVNANGTAEAIADASLYIVLQETSFGEGTLLDYFKKPASEVVLSDLYVFVDAMTDAEKAQLGLMGLRDTLLQGSSDFENATEEGEDLIEDYEDEIEAMEAISIYSGIDRSVFEDGVAFTDKATQHEKLTGTGWLSELLGSETDEAAWLQAIIYSSIATVTFTAIGVAATVIQSKLAAAVTENTEQLLSARSNWERIQKLTSGPNPQFYSRPGQYDFLKNGVTAAEQKVATSSRYLTAAKITKCVSFALAAIAFAFDVYALIEYFTTEDPTEEKIPHHLLTTVDTEFGTDYVYYETVKDQNGEAADMNHHEGNAEIGWLVLYMTKDANAGDPISAKSLQVQIGSDALAPDLKGAHLFNETAVLNVTAKNYTGVDDSVNGTYILFTTVAPVTGSAFTNGLIVLIAGAALIIGLGGGYFLAKGLKRKEN